MCGTGEDAELPDVDEADEVEQLVDWMKVGIGSLYSPKLHDLFITFQRQWHFHSFRKIIVLQYH